MGMLTTCLEIRIVLHLMLLLLVLLQVQVMGKFVVLVIVVLMHVMHCSIFSKINFCNMVLSANDHLQDIHDFIYKFSIKMCRKLYVLYCCEENIGLKIERFENILS